MGQELDERADGVSDVGAVTGQCAAWTEGGSPRRRKGRKEHKMVQGWVG